MNSDEVSVPDKLKMLSDLIVTPGWSLLVDIIEKGEIAKAKQDLEDCDFKELREVQVLQYKISNCRQLIALPVSLIEIFKTNLEDEIQGKKNESRVDKDDPYSV